MCILISLFLIAAFYHATISCKAATNRLTFKISDKEITLPKKTKWEDFFGHVMNQTDKKIVDTESAKEHRLREEKERTERIASIEAAAE